jgi:hypothetical protein
VPVLKKRKRSISGTENSKSSLTGLKASQWILESKDHHPFDKADGWFSFFTPYTHCFTRDTQNHRQRKALLLSLGAYSRLTLEEK